MNAVQALQDFSLPRDPQAFCYLVDTYNSLVYATCRRRLSSADDIDDAVQEVFVSLARQAEFEYVSQRRRLASHCPYERALMPFVGTAPTTT